MDQERKRRPSGAQDTITLPEGLVGLPELRRWILVDMDPPLPMKWLQSLDREGFRLPVTDPVYFTDRFECEVDDRTQGLLEAEDASELAVMIIATISPGGKRITGNLAAPVVVNAVNRCGVQMVLEAERFGMRQEIDYARFGQAVGECRTALSGAGSEVDNPTAAGYPDSRQAERVPVEI